MKIKNYIKAILHKIKYAIIRVDGFREHCEDKAAKVLYYRGDHTELDEVKEKIVESIITAAISYTPVIGGIASSLTSDQIKTVSELIVEYGHKAEKLAAKQLAKP